ncbi:MAG: HIT family hydrolase [Dethiosulfovibrio peptidovorans]|nr:MAG: HIT family hydrolase [Dethiosulfovibrio peptidovorans]
MNHLFAPWRIRYIMSENEPDGCAFCRICSQNDDVTNLVVHRGKSCFVVLNRYPYNSGHLMVVPYRHISDYSALDINEVDEMHDLSSTALNVMKKNMSPHGFNLGMNLGEAAGAGIADHLHLHVVPRWNGDTNFMPVLDDIRVLPQALIETCQVLRSAWPR